MTKYSVVTTFNQNGYNVYANKFIKSFNDKVDKRIPLVVYAEDCQPVGDDRTLIFDAKQTLVTTTPLHFIGTEENEALRLGNMLNQFVVSVEISCLPKDLPHGIDVDVTSLEIGDHLSLTDLVLPEGVIINALQHEDVEAPDQTICSVSEPKIIEEEEEIIEDGESEEGGEDSAEDSADSADADSKDGDDNE